MKFWNKNKPKESSKKQIEESELVPPLESSSPESEPETSDDINEKIKVDESQENTQQEESVEEPVSKNLEDEKIDDDSKVINLKAIFKQLKKYWWMLFLNCLIISGIAAMLIIEEPRVYSSSVKLAPEAEDPTGGGALSSIASTFGIDLGGMSSVDAIRPDLYPDLVESNDFIYNLFKLPVRTLDGNIYTDYYTYLKKYQRSSWWKKGWKDFLKKFKKEPPARNIGAGNDGNGGRKAVILSKDEEGMMESIRNNVICSVDKKSFIISITVTDQDPLVCALVADSVRARIQSFVTDYRTKKAAKDYQYYYSLVAQAKKEYEKSCANYSRYCDTHRDVILQSYISERDQLENDMQMKLNTYNAMITQAQQAKAKVQENTPAFTVMQNAFVPVKPVGPKRMIFVMMIVFLTFVITSLFICKGRIINEF